LIKYIYKIIGCQYIQTNHREHFQFNIADICMR